jgi:hypothetical protein
MNVIRKLISNLIPDSHVVIGHSKRALLPFNGDIGKCLFGLVTQGDLEVLADIQIQILYSLILILYICKYLKINIFC